MITFRLRNKTYSAPDFAGASEIYARLRDESGEGGSTFPAPKLMQGGKVIGRLSYNARVWDGEWPVGKCIFNPYAEG